MDRVTVILQLSFLKINAHVSSPGSDTQIFAPLLFASGIKKKKEKRKSDLGLESKNTFCKKMNQSYTFFIKRRKYFSFNKTCSALIKSIVFLRKNKVQLYGHSKYTATRLYAKHVDYQFASSNVDSLSTINANLRADIISKSRFYRKKKIIRHIMDFDFIRAANLGIKILLLKSVMGNS
ncbi:hypothetical protein PUN28_007337 [Cardiocondyla obscurior]|uniref:Uncharacterized protein n=1 Tax=Cardiocondyla obscurior TaxID=286306 RepID=A0AAW2G2Z5_9HYME